MNKKNIFLFTVLLLALLNVTSYADITPFDGVDFDQPTTNYSNGNWSLGWEFTPKYDVIADKLGFYDDQRNGLTEKHEVGLFDIGGNLLRNTTVTNNDPWGVPGDGNYFKWNGIIPITLLAGKHYVVSAVTGSELYTWDPSDFTEKWATFVTDRYHVPSGSGTLDYPETSAGNGNIKGYFGPNVGITPEPSSFILFGIGLGSLFFMKKKKTY